MFTHCSDVAIHLIKCYADCNILHIQLIHDIIGVQTVAVRVSELFCFEAARAPAPGNILQFLKC